MTTVGPAIDDRRADFEFRPEFLVQCARRYP
jgi:hypothetical protein